MARTAKHKLDSATARKRLKPRRKPYPISIAPRMLTARSPLEAPGFQLARALDMVALH